MSARRLEAPARGVLGGEDLIANADLDGAVAPRGPAELLDGPAGPVLGKRPTASDKRVPQETQNESPQSAAGPTPPPPARGRSSPRPAAFSASSSASSCADPRCSISREPRDSTTAPSAQLSAPRRSSPCARTPRTRTLPTPIRAQNQTSRSATPRSQACPTRRPALPTPSTVKSRVRRQRDDVPVARVMGTVQSLRMRSLLWSKHSRQWARQSSAPKPQGRARGQPERRQGGRQRG